MSFQNQPLLNGTSGRLDVIHELLSQEAEFERVVQLVRKNKEQWNKHRDIPDPTGELGKIFEILDTMCSPDFHKKYKIINLLDFRVGYDNKTFDVSSIWNIYEITQGRGTYTKQLRLYANQFYDYRCVYDLQLKCILDAQYIFRYMQSVLPPEKLNSFRRFLMTLQDNRPDDVQEFAWLVRRCMGDLAKVAIKIYKQISGKDVRDWLMWKDSRTKRSIQSPSVKTTPAGPTPTPNIQPSPAKPKEWTIFGSRGQKRQERNKKTLRQGGLRACLDESSRSPSPTTRTESDVRLRDMHRLLHEL
jgi:hypothetical protein